MTEGSRFSLSPTARRLVRSYGLVFLIALGFLLMAMFMREKPTVVPVEGMKIQEEVVRWR
jgi:hypothetical protein